MNAIPLTALKGVEVLRDGAAAQYGSDAIAGVINLSLNNSTGITTGFVQYGGTSEGDGDTISAGLNRGFDIGNEGGFINLSLEYRDADGTNRAERDTGGSLDVEPGTLSDDVRWSQGNSESEFTSLFYNMALPMGDGELYSFGGYSERTALGNGFYRNFNEASKNVTQVYSDGFLPRIYNEAQEITMYRLSMAKTNTILHHVILLTPLMLLSIYLITRVQVMPTLLQIQALVAVTQVVLGLIKQPLTLM